MSTAPDITKVPDGDRKTIECDVCGETIYHPATEDIDHRLKDAMCNKAMLGDDTVMCWWCYLQWYDGGKTDRTEIMHLSRLQRYKDMKK